MSARSYPRIGGNGELRTDAEHAELIAEIERWEAEADELCRYCESNPREPRSDACSTSFCVAESLREQAGR